jgi:Fe-S oxidoreductase
VQCLAPHRHNIIDIIEELRQEAVETLGPLPAHEKFANRIEAVHNPYGAPHHNRSLADIHGLPHHASIVYFIGCTSNYRETEIRDATISLLKKADVDFTVVDEYCCGSPLLRTGQTALVEDLAQHNRSMIQAAGAMRVVTSCAGCYRTLVKDYKKLELDLEIEVVHISQLLLELIEEGRLKIKDETHQSLLTYHDPCHLGRHMNEYESPREILCNLPVELVEMELTKENAWCCGSGGGCKAAYSDWSLQTATKRIEHARATDASTLVSSCPFCKRAFTDVEDSSLEILDLSELVDRFT